jgi:ADP-ribosyl-[dinitrogen reductase] hydrolase
MLGAIIGDIIGSRFERNNYKAKDFQLFDINCHMTDDSILTFAIADAYMNNKDYAKTLHTYGNKFRDAGYGAKFCDWLDNRQNPQPYQSWANGSAMRISALAWLIDDYTELMNEVKLATIPTHDHPEGIKGAQAIAACILMARQGYKKETIKEFISKAFKYDLDQTLAHYRIQKFDVSCQGSVPQAIVSFLHSIDFEDCLRTAVSTGGDTDTVASMACAIGEAYYVGKTYLDGRTHAIPQDLSYYAQMHFTYTNAHLKFIYDQFVNTLNNKNPDPIIHVHYSQN